MLKRGKKPLETESLECIPNKQPINKVTYLNGQNSRKKKTALFYISSQHPCKELEGPKTWVAIKCKRPIGKIEELLFEPHLLVHPPSKHFNIYNFIRNVIKRKISSLIHIASTANHSIFSKFSTLKSYYHIFANSKLQNYYKKKSQQNEETEQTQRCSILRWRVGAVGGPNQ